jgi:hypothetical protein
LAAANAIDQFIGAKLEKAGVQPAALADDATFLRRVTLDVIGLVPTPKEVSAFLADASKEKRAHTIDRLLADPRWADQWVPYWQDVLAENPAILKATLNNTGPFRWFLRDALRDNWSMDRFATALCRDGRQSARWRLGRFRHRYAERSSHGKQGADSQLRVPGDGDEVRALSRRSESSLQPG